MIHGQYVRAFAFVVGFAFASVVLTTSTVDAAKKKRPPKDNGVAASLHDLERKGRKLCMVSHAHDGKGVHKRKNRAKRAATRSWSSFTVMEYGTAWGRLNRAVGKTEQCSKFNGLWTCYVNARPCRR